MTSDWICNDTQSSATRTAKSGGDRATQLIVRWHHEWWHGGGYPDAAPEEIPWAARILRVADSYAAITDRDRIAGHEPVKRASAHGWLAGIEFDPRIVKVLPRSAHYPNSNRSRSGPMRRTQAPKCAGG